MWDNPFEFICALYKYDALDDLLQKRIVYLRSMCDEKGVDERTYE